MRRFEGGLLCAAIWTLLAEGAFRNLVLLEVKYLATSPRSRDWMSNSPWVPPHGFRAITMAYRGFEFPNSEGADAADFAYMKYQSQQEQEDKAAGLLDIVKAAAAKSPSRPPVVAII